MPSENTGGLIVCRPRPLSLPCGLTLLSDLHIGARSVDYKLIEKELRDAEKNNDRILINGDVFDAIIPSDKKRYRPSALHSRLSGVDDISNKIVDWAFELLSPYAHLIDMIGAGNHDDALTKNNSFDPVLALVDRLNDYLTVKTISYGGYCGFICYRIATKGRKLFNIFYHHGFGKSKLSDQYSQLHWIEGVDVVWLGHLHSRTNAHYVRMSPPAYGSTSEYRDVRFVRTGAYINTYKGQSQKSIHKSGGVVNYGVLAAHHPYGTGGARILLSEDLTVKVVQ